MVTSWKTRDGSPGDDRSTGAVERVVLPGCCATYECRPDIGRLLSGESVVCFQGFLISVPSGAGHTRGGFVEFSAYTASKAALTRLTETLAIEARDFGITVFALTSGAVRTEMLTHTFEPEAAALASGRAERMWEVAVPVERSVELWLFMLSGQADRDSPRRARRPR